MGIVLKKMKRNDEAITAFKKALEINHDDVLYLCNLGSVLLATGEILLV